MTAPDAADVLAGLHATTRDDATRLAEQLKGATDLGDVAIWALIAALVGLIALYIHSERRSQR